MLLYATSGFGQGTHKAVPVGSTDSPYGFYEYLPEDYSANGEKAPLLIFLHGAGEQGNGDSELSNAIKFGPGREVENGRHFPFVILSPQTSGNWDVGKLDDLINYARTNYHIDKDRIYLTGLSMGAMGLVDYIEVHADRIAAVVPIAGSGEASKSCNYSNVPLWAFHGDKDDVVPISGSQAIVNAYNECIPTPDPLARLTVLEGQAHWGWNEVYDGDLGHDIYAWFLEFSKGESGDPDPNNPPTVDAGDDRTVQLPENSLELEGEASDSDGEISRYAWEKVSGPSVEMEGAETATLELKNLQEGNYTFRLTVQDNEGAEGADELKVKVKPEEEENKAPLADAGPDEEVQLPLEELNLYGMAEDEDGDLRAFKWEKRSGPPVSMSGENTANLTLTNLQEGSYTLRFTATDNEGASGSDELTLTVKPASDGGEDDEVKITADAGPDKEVQLPLETYQLSGTATLLNCQILSYQWTKLSGPEVAMENAATANLELSALKAGEYTFRFTATSTTGESDTDEMKLHVRAADGGSGEGLPEGAVQGLSYAYYEIDPSQPWRSLPDFSDFSPVKTGTAPTFSLRARERNNHFAFVFTGYIKIEEAGTYFFYTLSDDGSKLYLNDELVVNNDGIHAEEVKYGKVTLAEGYQQIRIEFFENTGLHRLYVSYKGPGVELQELPRTKLFTVPGEQESSFVPFHQSGIFSREGTEAAPAAEMRLYPNPVQRFLKLQLGALDQDEPLTLTIIDLSGRKLYRKEQRVPAGEASLQLDLEALKLVKGTYVLLIESSRQERVQSFRFVKN